MRRTFELISCVALGLLVAIQTQAITLSFNPSSQFTRASSVDVALVISGLASGAPPSLSTFDVDISFNPDILAFASATFGDPVLGDQLDLFSLGSLTSATAGVGTANLFELSFDSQTDLDALQAGNFTLATLTFNTKGKGFSPLEISVNALGDSLGNSLTAGVRSGVIAVPEPSSLLLSGLGLVGLIGCIYRRKEPITGLQSKERRGIERAKYPWGSKWTP